MLPFTYLVTQIPHFTSLYKCRQVLCLSYRGVYFPIGFDAVVQETGSILCTSSLGKIWNFFAPSGVLMPFFETDLIVVFSQVFLVIGHDTVYILAYIVRTESSR